MMPAEAGPGVWQVVVGLYDPVTGSRFPIVNDAGEVVGDEATIATLTVTSPPTPDQACALIPATCASQVR